MVRDEIVVGACALSARSILLLRKMFYRRPACRELFPLLPSFPSVPNPDPASVRKFIDFKRNSVEKPSGTLVNDSKESSIPNWGYAGIIFY